MLLIQRITMKYNLELRVAKQLALKAGKVIMEYYRGNLEPTYKKDGSPVTEADVRANEIIVEGLRKYFPYDGIVSEELEKVKGDRKWYIDPIDGTRGFVEKNGEFAVHIGLCEETTPVLGVVYQPVALTLFYATPEHGAHIRRKGQNELTELSLITYDFNVKDLTYSTKGRKEIEENRILLDKIGATRNFIIGSEGLRVMGIATNIIDVRISGKGLNTWDVCAPQAILQCARGFVGLLNGKPINYEGQSKIGGKVVYARHKCLVDKLWTYNETL